MKNIENIEWDLCTYNGKLAVYVSMLPYPLQDGSDICIQYVDTWEVLFVRSADLATEEAVEAGKKLFTLSNDLKQFFMGTEKESWNKLSTLDKVYYMEMAKHIEFKEED